MSWSAFLIIALISRNHILNLDGLKCLSCTWITVRMNERRKRIFFIKSKNLHSKRKIFNTSFWSENRNSYKYRSDWMNPDSWLTLFGPGEIDKLPLNFSRNFVMKQSRNNNEISWSFLKFTASSFICKTIVVWLLDSELSNVSHGRPCVSG